MKIIDLLNKIANGEEVPSKIMYQDKIYYMVGNNDYENYEYDEEPTLMYAIGNTHNINDDIEIIEDISKEDKKIEKIDFDLLQSFEDDDDKYISIEAICKKIDEIIDYINKEE